MEVKLVMTSIASTMTRIGWSLKVEKAGVSHSE
jgi:hypothetical protein